MDAMPALWVIPVVLALAAAVIGYVKWQAVRELRWTPRVSSVVLAVIAGIVLERVLRIRKSLTALFTGAVMVTVGWFLAWLHLLFFDRLFLRTGGVKVDDERPVPPQRIKPRRPSAGGRQQAR